MTPETLKEAKNFKMQMKWSAIICWIATLAIMFSPKAMTDFTWLLFPVGGTILTIIFFQMKKLIDTYENLTK